MGAGGVAGIASTGGGIASTGSTRGTDGTGVNTGSASDASASGGGGGGVKRVTGGTTAPASRRSTSAIFRAKKLNASWLAPTRSEWVPAASRVGWKRRASAK